MQCNNEDTTQAIHYARCRKPQYFCNWCIMSRFTNERESDGAIFERVFEYKSDFVEVSFLGYM